MKKDILFIISDLKSGGYQKSLVSLLQCFDYTKYNVDLLILSYKGVFKNQIPNEVNIVTLKFNSSFLEAYPEAMRSLIKDRKFYLALKRSSYFLVSRYNKGKAAVKISKHIPKLDKEYDVAIDYQGQQKLYYMVDKIKAKKKISYFHSDYKKWDYYKWADNKYYGKVQYIVTVSDICKKSLDEVFPVYSNKTRVIENIISPKIIKNMAYDELKIKMDKNIINILTIGRVTEDKGYDIAIEACVALKNQGYKFRWYSIGTSKEIEKFKELVNEKGINEEFIFIGEVENPYPYIRECDIFVHPSKFEGKSVAVDEAKILNKPIVLTNFTTAYDQIKDEVNGLIVNMDGESLYKGVKRLIDDKDLREVFSANLRKESLGNESEVKKLYKLIEDI